MNMNLTNCDILCIFPCHIKRPQPRLLPHTALKKFQHAREYLLKNIVRHLSQPLIIYCRMKHWKWIESAVNVWSAGSSSSEESFTYLILTYTRTRYSCGEYCFERHKNFLNRIVYRSLWWYILASGTHMREMRYFFFIILNLLYPFKNRASIFDHKKVSRIFSRGEVKSESWVIFYK